MALLSGIACCPVHRYSKATPVSTTIDDPSGGKAGPSPGQRKAISLPRGKRNAVLPLTVAAQSITMIWHGGVHAPGGMSEWFMVAVLKTVVRKHRGFESLSLR